MAASDPAPWARFTQDPRRPETASLRASDRDRNVVLEVLTEGYADGRLDKDEYDERATAATAAKTLGDLPPIVADLIPETPVRRRDDLALASPSELEARAVKAYESTRRRAVSGMVIPSVITFVIWFVAGFGDGAWQADFPWPLFVVLGTGINVLRVMLSKQDIIEDERRRLERKQRKALEPPKPDKGT